MFLFVKFVSHILILLAYLKYVVKKLFQQFYRNFRIFCRLGMNDLQIIRSSEQAQELPLNSLDPIEGISFSGLSEYC